MKHLFAVAVLALASVSCKSTESDVVASTCLGAGSCDCSSEVIEVQRNEVGNVLLVLNEKNAPPCQLNHRLETTVRHRLIPAIFRIDRNYSEPRVKPKDIYVNGGYVERRPQPYYESPLPVPKKINLLLQEINGNNYQILTS